MTWVKRYKRYTKSCGLHTKKVLRKVNSDGEHLQNDQDKCRFFSNLEYVNAYTQDTGTWM